MTDLCKKQVCGGLITIVALLGVFFTIYGVQQAQTYERLSKLESGRDDIVRVIVKLESVEESVSYIRTRVDNFTQHGAVIKPGN